MNYKLTKQLKDAGFPGSETCEKNELYHPTLSQLIEACGDKFFRLVNFNGDSDATWQAEAHNFLGHEQGKYPEEAVAKLWLKLVKIIKFGKCWKGLEKL